MADDDAGGPDDPGPTDPAAGSNVVHGPWWGAGGCPNVETFAAYFDRRLPEAHRRRVLDHLSGCSACRRDLNDVTAYLLDRGSKMSAIDDPADRDTETAIDDLARVLTEELADARAWLDRDAKDAGIGVPEPATPFLDGLSPGRWRSKLPIAIRTAAVAGLVASVFLLGWWSSSRHPRALSAAAPRERPYAARFTGRLPWAPAAYGIGNPATGYQLYLPPESVGYMRAAARRGLPPDAPTPNVLGTVGASQVLSGRVEPGVDTLRRASAAQPRSAELLSDLGAGLLVRFETSDRLRAQGTAGAAVEDRDADLPAALEAMERALEISPRLEEALFNRALALERLHLLRSARKAWQDYLDTDDASGWAEEARHHLAAIAIPVRPAPSRVRAEIAAVAAGGESERLSELVEAHRQLARRSVQEDLLPGWGEARLAGDLPEASRQLRAAAAIAEEWEAETGDRTLRDAVSEIEGSTAGARERLATGYRALGAASRAFDAFDLDAAHAAAERALGSLPRTSPAFTWAALVRLACAFYRGAEVEPEALALVSSAPTDPASVGRAHWIVGLWHAKRGDLATGLAAYRQSLASYERLDETDSAVWLQFLVGDAYARMGASAAAWKHHRSALARAPTLSDNQRAQSILVSTATLALIEERPRAATCLLDEALAEPEVPPDQIAQAYLWRSRVLHELGRIAEARGELERAAAWLARAQPLERQYLSGDLNLAAGLLEVDPRRAVDRITRALARFRDFGPPLRLPGVLLARARARLRAGDTAAADQDLREGLVLLEEQARAADATPWTQRLDDPEQLFDERVQLALRQGQAEEALAIAEASRTRSLQMLATGGARGAEAFPSEALRPAEIRAQLEPRATLLFYSWFRDRVVLWRLGRESLNFVELPTPPAELARLVSAFGADLKVGAWTAATRETAMRLHAALLGPAELGDGSLIIVPDGQLHGLSFAALIDPESGRFLVEAHELSIIPSATAFLLAQARGRKQGGLPGDALVVGDPRVDPLLFPGVRPLAGARQEARAVATLYPHHKLLLGGAATRRAFLDAVGRQAVVHFSGHAISNSVDPARSSLPLAVDADGAEGLLVASDIARLDLTGTHTVVLSGCDTGVGEDGDREGPLSLARAFLVAGVPNVVASLWPIADAPSTPLMTAFHRRLRSGERPAAALRGAQLELLRGSDPTLRSPTVWGAFEAFGG